MQTDKQTTGRQPVGGWTEGQTDSSQTERYRPTDRQIGREGRTRAIYYGRVNASAELFV